MADEEDVLQSVFESVFRRAERGDYPDLCNRKELWRLLITITERKVINQVKFETRLVRGGYRKQFSLPASRSRSNPLLLALGPEAPPPSPETVAELVLTIEEFFGNLDDELQHVARLKLEGHSVTEIGDAIGRSRRTVDRLLRLLRAHLNKMIEES